MWYCIIIMNRENLAKLKILTVMAPLFYVAATEVFRGYLEGFASVTQVRVIILAATLLAAFIFSDLVFNTIARVQRLLDQERQRIAAIFHHTSDAVLLLDEAGKVVAMNQAGRRLTSWGEEAIRAGRVTADALFAITPGEIGARQTWWQYARDKGQVPYFEAVISTAGGVGVPVTGSATAIPAPDGGMQLALIMRDMSEKKTLEAEVERRRRQAEGLYDIGLEMASLQDFEGSLPSVLRQIREILSADMAGWVFFEDGTGDMGLRFFDAPQMVPPPEVPVALVRQALDSGRPLVENLQTATVAAVPILLRGRPAGALLVGSAPGGRIAHGDLLFLSSVATQAAIALENRELYARGQGQAMLDERERLAKEMHDGFGQTLTYLTAMTATVEHLLRKGKVEEALGRVKETRDVLTAAHQEVRAAIFNLRQHPSDEDLVSQVNTLLEQFRRQSGIEAEVVADTKGQLYLPFDKGIQVLRVIQEALNNVWKHSGASRVDVTIVRQGGELRIAVSDNGCGFDPTNQVDPGSAHFGLGIMRERSQAVGGRLEIRSSPGAGTTVELQMPLRRWARNEPSQETGVEVG